MSGILIYRAPWAFCFLWVTGLAVALLGCAQNDGSGDSAQHPAAAPASQGPPPATVRVADVTQETLVARWDVVGQLVQLRQATIAAEVSGKIVSMPVEEGDHVVAGQTVLAEVDGVWTRLALDAAEANIKSVEAKLDQARRDLKYLEELAQRGSANIKEVEDARSTAASEAAALDAARAERIRQTERMDRLKIKAPFDGVIIAKHTDVGDWVSEGSAIAEIISTGPIDAIVNVPEQLVAGISAGTEIEVIIDALRIETKGQVVAINPMGSRAARTYPVKIRLDDRGGLLKPGMSVIARVPTAASDVVLTVPRDAVVHSADGAAVWAAIGEPATPMAMKLPVKVLFGHGDRYAVQTLPGMGPPLAAGMNVVIEGGEKLFPTQPLIWDGMPVQKSQESSQSQQMVKPDAA